MNITIGSNTSLEIGPGIRLSVRDNALVIERDPEWRESHASPVPHAIPIEGVIARNGVATPLHAPPEAAKAAKAKVGRPRKTPPQALPEPPRASALALPSRKTEETENTILSALLATDDPYRWRFVGEILQLAFPGATLRLEGKATRLYESAQACIARLALRHELDDEPEGGVRGRGKRLRYRLHQPNGGAHTVTPAEVQAESYA